MNKRANFLISMIKKRRAEEALSRELGLSVSAPIPDFMLDAKY
jgi:hypothetical protein